MRKRWFWFGPGWMLWLAVSALAGCNLPQARATPTVPVALRMTQTALVDLMTQVAGLSEGQTTQPAAGVTGSVSTASPGTPPAWMPTLTATPTVEHHMIPGEPPRAKQKVFDTVSGSSAHQGAPNQPPAGDEYHWNLYERPFNAYTQDRYFPELDIVEGDITTDGTWLYVTIALYGPAAYSEAPAPAYGLELDLDIDGRGEWLVWAQGPYTTEWSTNGVRVYRDADEDVGEVRACRDDPPQDGTSYETMVFDSGQGVDPDAAWVRLIPGERPQVQLALKYALIDRDPAFMWWVWADRGVNHPDWMDYHDHFTLEEAGEPFQARPHYPIKAIAEVDNTCHWVFGFVPDGSEPCICPGEYATPTPTTPPTPTMTPTPQRQHGQIQGYLFKDRDGDRVYDPGEGVGGFTVELRSGACGGPLVSTTVSASDGSYHFVVGPGMYCVRPQTAVTWIPASYTFELHPGEVRSGLNFRYPAP